MVNCSLKKNRDKPSCRRINQPAGEGSFQLVLPKRDNSGQKIDNFRYGKYIDKINEKFGGSTTHPNILGCFKNKKKKVECEPNILINAVRDFEDSKLHPSARKKKLESDYNFMKRLSRQAGKEFGQESIFVQFDRIEDASFIPGERKERLSKRKIFDDFFNREV